jgi:chromosome segregation ATPase
MGIAADFFGVIGFVGITKESLVSFLQSNWRDVALSVTGLCLVASCAYLIALKRAAAAEAANHDVHIRTLHLKLEAQGQSLTQASSEANALKAELDEHTATLREAFGKYQDLVERCDAVVIQFSRVVEEFIGSGFFVRYTTVSDSTEAKAIINALMNPIRVKLTNFHELTKRALQETKNALSESERTANALGEIKQQLAAAQAEKLASVDALLQKRQRLEQNLQVALSELASIRSEVARREHENAELSHRLQTESDRFRALERASTQSEFVAHFIKRIDELELEIQELFSENKALARENAVLERIKVRRKSK